MASFFRRVSALMREDFPTLLRPATAISGASPAIQPCRSAALVMNSELSNLLAAPGPQSIAGGAKGWETRPVRTLGKK